MSDPANPPHPADPQGPDRPDQPDRREPGMRDYAPYAGILLLLTFIMVLIIFLKVTGVV